MMFGDLADAASADDESDENNTTVVTTNISMARVAFVVAWVCNSIE